MQIENTPDALSRLGAQELIEESDARGNIYVAYGERPGGLPLHLGEEIKVRLESSFPFALELLEDNCQSLLIES